MKKLFVGALSVVLSTAMVAPTCFAVAQNKEEDIATAVSHYNQASYTRALEAAQQTTSTEQAVQAAMVQLGTKADADTTKPSVNYDKIQYSQTMEMVTENITPEKAVELFTDPSYVTDDSGSATIMCDKWVMENGADGLAAFDATVAGKYKLRFYAVDAAGNRSNSFDIYVSVGDTTTPTVNYDKIAYSQTLELTQEEITPEKAVELFTEPSYVTDNDKNMKIVCDKWVMDNGADGFAAFDPTTAGTYKLRFYAVDTAGHESGRFDIYVTVQDTTKPTINYKNIQYTQTLELTQDEITPEKAAELFTDPSYATDNDTNIKFVCDKWIMENGAGGHPAFDPSTVGTYTLRFWAVDTAGNQSARFDITVKVQDTTAPTLDQDKIDFEQTMTVTKEEITPEKAVELFTDPSCASDLSGNVTIVCDEDVMNNGANGLPAFNPSKSGTYVLRFYAVDGSGNRSESFDITIHVVDTYNLNLLVEVAKSYDLDQYQDAGKPEFIDALAKAEETLANIEDLSQEELDVVADNLLTAMLNLRLKP